MKFRSSKEEEIFRSIGGDTSLTGELDSLVEEYKLKKFRFLDKVFDFWKGEKQKHAWRKHRMTFKFGIQKFHRNTSIVSVARKLASMVFAGLKPKKGLLEGIFSPVILKYRHFDKFEILGLISTLKSDLASEGEFFDLEESYAELEVDLLATLTEISDLERGILLDKEVSLSALEALLSLVGPEGLSELGIGDVSDDMCLLEAYIIKHDNPEDTAPAS